MNTTIHLAPNAPWAWFVLGTVALAVLGVWAYRFAVPPLPALARRALPALRIGALVSLLWLLAQPVIERAQGAAGRLIVLLDRSNSMELPVTPGGSTRADGAARAAEELRRLWRGGGGAAIVPFATRLGADTTGTVGPGATALGDVLAEVARSADADLAAGVVVVSDGVVNTGSDPVAAASALGLPVSAVVVGSAGFQDRAIAGVEASAGAQVGRVTPVRVHVTTTEPRGATLQVRLLDGVRELGRATVVAPGSGAEATAEFRVTPAAPGLAVWTARVDSLAGEISVANNSRQVAVEVAPGRLGVVMVSAGLNWDFAFLRRALAGDSSLALTTWVRGRDGWSGPARRRAQAPAPDELRGQAVLILDGVAAREISAEFDRAARAFVAGGGALIALGGPPPGVTRYRAGAFASDLAFDLDAESVVPNAAPEPSPQARDWLAWDDDPARGERAWRAAAPLGDLAPILAGAGDRVLLGAAGKGPPLMLVRHIGRGQALIVNGTGLWRWSLSGHDELSGERGRQLWRGLTHRVAEPVQGEPLRIRPERWLSSRGETVRLFATLQDAAFRPVSGASVEGELRVEAGPARAVTFVATSPGSYVASIEDLPPGRYRVAARATRAGRELGRAATELAVDRWSLEEARTLPDSAGLAALAQATGGRVVAGGDLAGWTRSLGQRPLARARAESARLWESPWVFAIIVAALSLEWAWRRRRGLP